MSECPICASVETNSRHKERPVKRQHPGLFAGDVIRQPQHALWTRTQRTRTVTTIMRELLGAAAQRSCVEKSAQRQGVCVHKIRPISGVIIDMSVAGTSTPAGGLTRSSQPDIVNTTSLL
jgi:hypothetical protein